MTLPAAIATGRVNIAFDDPTLEPDPTWTRIDDNDNLVASFTIDRGRSVETERTDGARATVQINDRDGILDPTNTTGPYYTKIQPLIQCCLGRYNPVATEWQTRFRGFIAEYNYGFDPSQRVNRLTLELVDLFEILQAIEMLPGEFGDTPDGDSEGQVFFAENTMVGSPTGRIPQIMGNAGIDPDWYVAFSGNVDLYKVIYSPAESAMTAIQEASDAEFPGVSNVYTDRFGRLVFHGRLAKFDPAGVKSGGPVSDETWDWHHWHAGDGAAVVASPTTRAQIREFAMNRGLAQVVNSAFATPHRPDDITQITEAELAAQKVTDLTSIGLYGIRSWSAQDLLTMSGNLDGSTDLEETFRFAQYQVDNRKDPHNRVTLLTVKAKRPGTTGAAINWRVLCEADISDRLDVTIASPGGGGLNEEPFYIEGIHEVQRPLNADYDDVTVSFDVSPVALSTDSEGRFPTS